MGRHQNPAMPADAPPLSADDLVTMRAFADLSFTGDSLGRWRTVLALAERALAQARKPASDEEIERYAQADFADSDGELDPDHLEGVRRAWRAAEAHGAIAATADRPTSEQDRQALALFESRALKGDHYSSGDRDIWAFGFSVGYRRAEADHGIAAPAGRGDAEAKDEKP